VRLRSTRQLAASFGDSIEQWPQLWPAGPAAVQAAHQRFKAAIGSSSAPRSIACRDVHTALDEWLMSSDRRRLSVRQRAVCGCALLELFASCKTVTREAPDILTAILNIAPAVPTMAPTGVDVVRRVLMTLRRRRRVLHLSDDEYALIVLASYISNTPVRRQSWNPELVDRLCATVRRDATAHDLERLRRIVAGIAQWSGLPASVRRRLRTKYASP
jgi:hypothetical protein